MPTNNKPPRRSFGIVGLGNSIAGDDGAGIMVVRILKNKFASRNDLFFHELTGDLLEMADLVDGAERFIFCDAISGARPGEIEVIRNTSSPPLSPSFHQTDIASVMNALKSLRLASPFPDWELWGIVIKPPLCFDEGLSPPVAGAVETCVSRLTEKLGSLPAIL